MRVFRTALLATGFVLAGLAACQTRHKPIVQVNYDDFTAVEFKDCKQTKDRDGNPLIVCDSHSDWLNADGQPAELTPGPPLTPHELGMINSWYAEPTPSPSPTEFFGSDGAPNMICNDSNIGDLASVNSAIWRCNGFYWYAMEPTPSPTPTPAADLGDTGCDAAHAGRRNIDMEGSEWRCLWVLADKNSPAKQYRWAQVAASPLPSPSPMPDKDGVPLTCKGDGKADALGFDMSVRCSHGIVVFADNSSPAASPTPTPDRLAARQQFFDCPVKFTARDGAVKYLDMQFMSNEKLQCSYREWKSK